jgi:hypothetical protein
MSALEQLVAQGAVTVPQRLLMQLETLSINMLTALYRAGEIDSVVIAGRQRRVIIGSYLALLKRRQLGVARPEAERVAAIEAYQRSLLTEGSTNAARARTGITPGTRAKGRRKAAALAVPRQNLFPRQPESRRRLRPSSASKSVVTEKDSVTTT